VHDPPDDDEGADRRRARLNKVRPLTVFGPLCTGNTDKAEIKWGGLLTERTSGSVRVAVAQPKQLLAEAIGCAAEGAGLQVAATHHRVGGLVRALARDGIDVLIVDHAFLERTDPPVALADLREIAPGTRIVLLANDLTPDVARVAHEAEVEGLVLKTSSTEDLDTAVRHVAAGQGVFPAGFLATFRRAEEAAGDIPLSPRQLEVLELLAEGLTNEQIGRRLHLSANTVKFHVREIYDRLGAHNRIEAASALRRLHATHPAFTGGARAARAGEF
jgi:DNA-binding NarL/FixJ family response regulator